MLENQQPQVTFYDPREQNYSTQSLRPSFDIPILSDIGEIIELVVLLLVLSLIMPMLSGMSGAFGG